MTAPKEPEDEYYELDGDLAAPSAETPAPNEGRADTQSSSASTETAAPAERLAKLQAERDELWQTLVRLQADFENYRKRIERESRERGQRAVARMIQELLPVLDAFERAVAAHDDPAYEEYRKGFELIYRQLWDALAREGLKRVEAQGKPFNPHVHQAIERVETNEYDDGTVVEELQPGYIFHGQTLRPATVRVAVHPVEQPSKARDSN